MTSKSSEKKPAIEADAQRKQPSARFEAVWAPELVPFGFLQISEVFLHQFHRLADPKKDKKLSDSEFVLLVHLMSHKRGNQMVFPSVATLARRMKKTDRQIMRLTARLEDRGLLVKHLKRGGSVRYDMRPLVNRVTALIPREKSARERKQRERDERNLPPDLRSEEMGESAKVPSPTRKPAKKD